ncbi:MAG: glycosyltransferase family 39 protein [Candidatus Aureabacteria bacterium]|nr:glycosyltransferase family 39 protein [Candidatus Auribacterota bacterium]
MNFLSSRMYLLFVALVTLVSRLPFILLYPCNLTYDSGMVGVMARNMLKQARFEPFFYGHGYSGTLETFFSVFFILLFGETKASLHASIVVLYLFTMGATYLLAKELFNEKVAGLSLLFLLFPSFEPLVYSYYPRVVYAVTSLFSVLLLWITVRILKKNRTGDILLWGLIAGLGWWNHSLIIFSVATSLLFILFYRPSLFFAKKNMWALPSFLLGSLPWWIANIHYRFITVQLLHDQPDTPFQTGIWNMFHHILPGLLYKEPMLNPPPYRLYFYGTIFVLTVLLLVLYFIPVIKKFHFSPAKENRFLSLILPLMVTVTIVIFICYRFRRMTSPRFVLSIYFPISIMMAASFIWLMEKWKKTALTLLVIFLLLRIEHGYSGSRYILEKSKRISDLIDDKFMTPLSTLNEPIGVTPTSEFRKAPQIDFLSKGKIQLASAAIFQEKNKTIELNADAAENPFLLYTSTGFEYDRYLSDILPVQYDCPVRNDQITVLNHIRYEPRYCYRTLPLSVSHTHSYSFHYHGGLFDRNHRTCAMAQKIRNRYHILVKLSQSTQLGKIIFFPPDFLPYKKNDLQINVSDDGISWTKKIKQNRIMPVYTSSHKIYFNWIQARYEFEFPPERVSYVEFVSSSPFSMAECYLFEPLPLIPRGTENVASLAEWINTLGIEKVFVERHLSAKLIKSSLLKKTVVVQPFNDALWYPMPVDGHFTPEKESSLILSVPSMSRDLSQFLDIYGFHYQRINQEGHDCFYQFSGGPKTISFYWNQMGLTVQSPREDHLNYLLQALQTTRPSVRLQQLLHLIYELSPTSSILDKFFSSIQDPYLRSRLTKWSENNQRILKPCRVDFESSILLKGYFLKNKKTRQGDFIQACFLLERTGPLSNSPAFFLHFNRDSKLLFQGDFDRNEDNKTALEWLLHENQRIIRIIPVPPDVRNLNDLIVNFGIWLPDSRDKRCLKINDSSLPLASNAVTLDSNLIK